MHRGWLVNYNTREVMLAGDEPEESVSILYDEIVELEVEDRRITHMTQAFPNDDDEPPPMEFSAVTWIIFMDLFVMLSGICLLY